MTFSAANSLLGYLFQCRYALLESLRKLRKGEEFTSSIETLDNVVFESYGEPAELLQTKHHIGRAADLSDASLDLWKSIRIWCEGITDGSIPKNSSFFLITTSRSAGGSAAHYLRTGVDRDPSEGGRASKSYSRVVYQSGK